MLKKYLVYNFDCGRLSSIFFAHEINRGSYMSAHILLNLLNELGKRDKMRGLPSLAFYFYSPTRLINSIIQEHEC